MSCCGVNLEGLDQKQALDAISRAVSARGMTRCLSQCLDRVLGTAVEEEVDAESEVRAFQEFERGKEVKE